VGQLGQGNALTPQTPNQIFALSGYPPVTQLAAGGDHALILLADGRVYAFGDNSAGQLGLGVVGSPVMSPTPVPLPGQAIEVAAGYKFSLALLADGRVFAFGINDWGQLGLGLGFLGIPVPDPLLVPLPGAAIHVAAGFRHSLVLDEKLVVWAFGHNESGELGVGYADGVPHPSPELVLAPNTTHLPNPGWAKNLAAGFDDSFVWNGYGEGFAFGSDDGGKLGLESTWPTDVYTPTLLSLYPIYQISAGWRHTLVLAAP
jgi:alpha-tubulin suppressor-like RCC1 family protein